MMKLFILSTVIVLSYHQLFGQIVEIFNKPISLKQVKSFEDSIGSVNKGFEYFGYDTNEKYSDVIKNRKQAVLIFERNEKDFYPNLHTWYFFNDDSVITEVKYNWGFYNTEFNPTENLKILQQEKNRRQEYLLQYKKIKEILVKLLGREETISSGIKSNETNYSESIWDRDKFRVYLIMNFDPTLERFEGMDFWRGGHSEIKIEIFYK